MATIFGHGRLRLYLLKLLDESPRHGYEVIRLLEDRFMGIYAPSAGTIYPRLARMEREGLVAHDDVGGRKVYRLTDAGRAELNARLDELAELEDEITDSVHKAARTVQSDVRDMVRTLRDELKQAAGDIRRQTRDHGAGESAPSAAEPSARGHGPAAEGGDPASAPGGAAGPASGEGLGGPSRPGAEDGPGSSEHDRTGGATEDEPAAGTGGRRRRDRRSAHSWWQRDWEGWAGEMAAWGELWAHGAAATDPARREAERALREFVTQARQTAREAAGPADAATARLRTVLDDALARLRRDLPPRE
ncbi:helix-turn-helix transcriptional regulator [Allonocardiopsis opalescens]|uniref:DNA-binding PadR family transcriptional regulator n=1 Tax=Allonocardiopsis opalescens TaxID=1144618 RepID=A0A2T0QDT6_9ACTN|nr:helix-turn-helix transcriptional regulator [Allonocardiopsis opalescens]PRY02068.1 DNA-binding PadR family transcriptional regulator [Allonocardiopsis opalescens]